MSTIFVDLAVKGEIYALRVLVDELLENERWITNPYIEVVGVDCKGEVMKTPKQLPTAIKLSDRCRLGGLFDDEAFAKDALVHVHGEGRECDRKRRNVRRHCAFGGRRGQSLDLTDYEGMNVNWLLADEWTYQTVSECNWSRPAIVIIIVSSTDDHLTPSTPLNVPYSLYTP